jgi:HD-GYP domain-containing protein (c-di-GMP phosphodiesterase class II)
MHRILARRLPHPRAEAGAMAGGGPAPLKQAPGRADGGAVKRLHVSSSGVVWYVVAAGLAVVSWLTVFGPLGDRTWNQPQLLFSLVTVAAATCVIAATIVIALADRREMAEVGLLGTALMAASVLPLVHGLVTPEVLYDQSDAFRSSAYLTLPIAVALGAPLLIPNSTFGRWAARRWRDWTLLSLMAVFVLASAIVFFPDVIVMPSPTSAWTIMVTAAMAAALVVFSRRQLRYFELGRRIANLVASLSLLLIAMTALLPMVQTPYSIGFWWLHLSGALGVLGVCVGLAVSKWMSKSAQDILAPVLARDPLVAFELGLSPTVHRFVADLELKDQMTRDHVVRTGELALRVGERFRLSGSELRELALAAMLHDVGKLHTPDDILKKPASLTAAEYEVIKLHPVQGEEMLAAEPALAGAAHIVRHHHERMDGRGYPDGLAGHEIPLASRIIAACDALDAMTHERQYRSAMPIRLAFAILRENAGTQWDPAVVEQVISVLPTMPVVSRLDEVGRGEQVHDPSLDRAPNDISEIDVSELLVTVDAEI